MLIVQRSPGQSVLIFTPGDASPAIRIEVVKRRGQYVLTFEAPRERFRIVRGELWARDPASCGAAFPKAEEEAST